MVGREKGVRCDCWAFRRDTPRGLSAGNVRSQAVRPGQNRRGRGKGGCRRAGDKAEGMFYGV